WESWPDDPPRDAKGWLVTVAWRKFLDLTRADVARHAREERVWSEPEPGATEHADDTLRLYFRCAHASLIPASAVALPLRAVGGLPTRQIADRAQRQGHRGGRAPRRVGAPEIEQMGRAHV